MTENNKRWLAWTISVLATLAISLFFGVQYPIPDQPSEPVEPIELGANFSNPIDIEDSASAAAPALTFQDDTDTGFWRSAADTLNAATGGTEQLELDASEFTIVPAVDVDNQVDIDGTADEVQLSITGYTTQTNDLVQFSGGTVDLQGNVFDLDSDGDTSITADTDDQIDIEISGQDVIQLTASDATFLMDVYAQTPSVAKTSSYTATQAESGALLSNAGASAELTLTLPAAVPGLQYCIFVAETYTITVDVDDADQILDLTNAAGDAVQNTGTVGDSLCLIALDTAEWANLQEIGTWSDVN